MKKEVIIKIILIFIIVVLLFCGSMLIFGEKGFKFKTDNNNIIVALDDDLKLSNKVDVCYSNGLFCTKVNKTYKGNVDTNKVGDYKLNYTFKHKNKTIKKDIVVKVVDKTPPVINLKDNIYYICKNGKISKYNLEAIDNVDGNLTEKVTPLYENNILYFFVKDTSGNITKKEAKSEIKDTDAPKIKLNGDNVYLNINGKYKEPGYEAYDTCDGNLTNDVKVINNIDINKSGNYQVTYEVKDSSNNSTIIKRNVYVLGGNMNNSSSKIVYLTFDDGPSAYTNKLLDILKKYNVKATFFVTGNRQEYADTITRAYNEGHAIGLHTYTHNYNIYSSEDSFFNDLYNIQNYVEEQTGAKIYIMRFAGGSSNTVSKSYNKGIMTKLVKEVENNGFKYFDWNVSSGDGGFASKEQVINNVIEGIKNKKSSYVLMHNTKEETINAVEDIIKYALSNEYNFQPITMTTASCHHGTNN